MGFPDRMTQDVLIETEGSLGHITLNRPKALNALTLAMLQEIDHALRVWEADSAIRVVLLDGAGERGFCAGGDIRALYEGAGAADFAATDRFFHAEYALNGFIGRYAKPIVAIMDGIVMGGGVGLSGHASHRIVTEKSNVAMPECGIGFFPDVGGTYLLGRAPGELGTHLALTSARADAADALLAGLADYFVPAAKLDRLATKLRDATSAKAVAMIISALAEPAPAGKLASDRAWIDACYAASTVEEIVLRLRTRDEPDAQAALKALLSNAPTSLKVTLKALRSARDLGGLDAALDQEYRLARSFVRQPDFVEGVRAAIVDKDRMPRWNPARLEDVDPAVADRYFLSVDGTELDLA